MDQNYMKERPVLPLVLAMSFPMVLSMLVNALYNIVDSYFVARISEHAMTALSLVYPLQNLTVAVGVGFGIGINAAAAFYLGAGEKGKADAVVSQGIVLNGVHGILLTAGGIAVMPGFLRLFTQDLQVIEDGIAYSRIVFLFSAVLTLGVSFEKIFQAVGRMRVSMGCMLLGCIVNIILDPVLIFGAGPIPAMGVRGAAVATGIGQAASLAGYIVIFLARPLPVKFSLKKGVITGNEFKRIYRVGIPAALNIGLPSLLITCLNGILAELGQIYVLILGIYYKLQTFIYLTANGIVQGIRPLVGFNYGAGRRDRVKSILNVSLALGAGIMALGTGLCMAVPERLMGMFSESPVTIAEGAKALRIISCGFVVSAVSVMISGTFEGMGKGLPSLVISLIRYIGMIPVAFVLCGFFGAAGVWSGFAVTEVIGAAVSVIMLRHVQKTWQGNLPQAKKGAAP